jgi:hypothetical protein
MSIGSQSLLRHVEDDGIRDFIACGFRTGVRKGRSCAQLTSLGRGLAPQVGFEPRNSLLHQPTPAHSILIWGEVSRQPLRMALDCFSPRRGTVEGQSGPRPFANVQDLVLCRLTDGTSGDRDHDDRLAGRRKDLEFVALGYIGACRIALDDHADIACAQSFLGQVLRQHHTLVERESHGFSAGTSVINLRGRLAREDDPGGFCSNG